MPIHNVEIEAHSNQQEQIRQLLHQHNALFKGTDHQIDTYFKVPNGRLKLRQGNIECALIHYRRPDESGPKLSEVHLYHPNDAEALKAALTAALGILTVVDKKREIYFIDNVKFQVDNVESLGTFVEIEAIDKSGEMGIEKIQKQCRKFMMLFGILESELVHQSYSDLLLTKKSTI